MEHIPVVLFTYNRLEHTKKTIESLMGNTLAEKVRLTIYSDGGKTPEDVIKVECVRRYLETIVNNNNFKSCTLVASNINNGLANSVINGITTQFKQEERVIVLEDDIITSKDFLEYMMGALDFYRNDNRIWAISGHTIECSALEKYRHDVYLGARMSSWGWATWKDRWEQADWDVSNYKEFCENKKRQRDFNKGGRDLSRMLKLHMENKIDSWAIRWGYSQFVNNRYTVYPKYSKVKNIGLDGSGVHCSKVEDSKMAIKERPILFEHIKVNHKLIKEIACVVKPRESYRDKIIKLIWGNKSKENDKVYLYLRKFYRKFKS